MHPHAMPLVVAVNLVVLTACTRFASEKQPAYDATGDAPRAMLASEAVAPSPARAPEAPVPLAEMQAALKLIRTATLTVEVERFDAAATAIADIAQSNGGYVADGRRSEDARGASRGVVTMRVPSERFGAALGALRELGEVKDEAQSTQDVTKAYADLEIRVAIKREAAQRLREILGNRTGRLSDVLEVERELSRVVEEIERMEGERRFYDQQVAMSTITVSLYEPGARRGTGSLAPLTNALGDAVRTLATSVGALVYAIAFILPWLLLAALAWWGAKRVRASLVRREGKV